MSQQEPEDRIIADSFARLRSEDQIDAPNAQGILQRKTELPSGPPARRLLFVGATALAAALTIVVAGYQTLVAPDPRTSVEVRTARSSPVAESAPPTHPLLLAKPEPLQSPAPPETASPDPVVAAVIELQEELKRRAPAKLPPASVRTQVEERITVTAAAPAVELRGTATMASVDEFAPPAGQFYRDALILEPGVNDASGSGRTEVHGSRSRDFKAVVSGVSNVDPLTGRFTTLVKQGTVEELKIVTGGAGVEFGSAQGGFANIASIGYVAPVPKPRSTEGYNPIEENDFVNAADDPLSTFSIDVDTASYSNSRRFLNRGEIPPADSIRIEEWINYFDYDYPAPSGNDPFSVNLELGECPWNRSHLLARIGLQADWVPRSETAGSNLVFLIDVSGSMDRPEKLPLVKRSVRLLADELTAQDRVAIVVYAGASGLVLDSTSGTDRTQIRQALEQLDAGGGTAGAAGIHLAYQVARDNFIEGGVNRVILATDGDFNVGVTGHSELLDIIQADADNGIFLTALGFGTGNLQDGRLEQLADKGNGNYAYIDSLNEARKVLVEELEGTLYTVAKDVKIQVEFNPRQVAAYRLIGYENRKLAHADFNDDTKDAGEIGSGHSVTALYEIVPAGEALPRPKVDALKYQEALALTEAAQTQEWMTVKLRYKEPAGAESKLIERVLSGSPRQTAEQSLDFEFATSVAAFGMLLRGSEFVGNATIDSVRTSARRGSQRDAFGYRAEFLELIDASAPLLNKERDAGPEG